MPTGAGTTASWIQLTPGSATGALFVNTAGSLVAQSGTGAIGVPEVWHTVTLPASWTGRLGGGAGARIKFLAENKLAIFDIDMTAPGAGATSGTFGTFPSSAYFPTDERVFAMGYTGAAAGTNARLIVSASPTASSFQGLPAGFTGSVQMTVIFPLD